MNRPTEDTLSGRGDAEERIERVFAVLRQPADRLAESVGTSTPEIPGYDRVEFLASGGQGSVYKARQVALGRDVALKVIRGGAADPGAVARLRSEAKLVAGLDHPHIVPLYEIGEHAGLHFIAMAYVEGKSLAEWAGREPPHPAGAANLVTQIAGAAQFAHDKGVIHRDLKPANVLMTADGRPRLTDFGLAKELRSESSLSASGQIVGTPGYMPPEQALGQRDRIGPRSDVYSLGAILYFLLTGRPPFQSAAPLDTLKQVVHDDPISPRRQNPTVPRDLETVCLKCLEKEPGRRYASAAALADDLRRFLDGKPILARPVPRAERFWRWCRRNPVNASLTAVLVLVAVAAFTTVSRKWREAVQNAEQARRQERIADENYRKAREIVNRYFTTVSEEVLLNEPGMQPLRRQLLELALGYYREFLSQRADDPEVRAEVASAYFHVGRITAELGSREEAVEPYRRAIAIYDRLRVRFPGEPECRGELVRALNNLGLLKKSIGEPREAYDLYCQGIEIAQTLAVDEPDVPEYHGYLASCYTNLATLYNSVGDRAEAADFFDRAINIRRRLIAEGVATDRDRAGLAIALSNLGKLHLQNRDYDRAAAALGDVIPIRIDLVERHPEVTRYRADLATGYDILGTLTSRTGDRTAARGLYLRSVEILEGLIDRNPSVAEYLRSLAGSYFNLGYIAESLGESAEAEALYERALTTLRPLAERNPDTELYQRILAKYSARLDALRAGTDPPAAGEGDPEK